MSSMFPDHLPCSPRAVFERQAWGELFGDLIRSAREERTLSIEEAARAAGMSASEWEAVESGTVPSTREQIGALAAGLGLTSQAMGPVVLFCRAAWGR